MLATTDESNIRTKMNQNAHILTTMVKAELKFNLNLLYNFKNVTANPFQKSVLLKYIGKNISIMCCFVDRKIR